MAPNPEKYIVHVDIILEPFQNGYTLKFPPFYHHRQKGKSQHNFMPKANGLRVIPKLASYLPLMDIFYFFVFYIHVHRIFVL